MGNISLRAYFQKIESLIDASKNDEAIAHCKHILLAYPKNLETYRLLAKAYLETRRYPDALDILQRILSVVPDDFIAHVGMSIIREDEKNLDAAIWHMERAFDVQPSNIAVQDELKRLLGQRDGTEPAKIRLTRGALVRMYLRGNLHTQAIAEARAALKEEPSRSDLKVILARAYNLAGLKSESIDLAHQLLAELPYCLEAHKILAANPQLAGSEDTATAHQTLAELDPYYEFISASMPSIDQIPDNSVLIEEFDWQADESFSFSTPPIPPAVQVSEKVGTTQPASWTDEEIQALELSSDTGDETIPSSTGAEPGQPEDFVPDWMKDAGWQAGETPEKGTPALVMDEEEAEDIAPAEIPDWLKALAPQEEEGSEEEAGEIFEKLSAELPGSEVQTESTLDTVEAPQSIVEISAMIPDSENLAEEIGEDIPEPVESVEELSEAITEEAELAGELIEKTDETEEPELEFVEPGFDLEESAQAEQILEEAGKPLEPAIAIEEELEPIQDAAPAFEEATSVPTAEEQIFAVEEPEAANGLSDELPDWLRAALSIDDSEVTAGETEQSSAEEVPGWIKEEELNAAQEVAQEEIVEAKMKVEEIIDETIQPEALQPAEAQLEALTVETSAEPESPVLDLQEMVDQPEIQAEAAEMVAEELAGTSGQVETALPGEESLESVVSEAEESVDQVLRKDLELPDEVAAEFEGSEDDLGEPAPLDLPDWLKGYEETRVTSIPDADELKISELAASLEETVPEDNTEITSPVEVASAPDEYLEELMEPALGEEVTGVAAAKEEPADHEYPVQPLECEPEELIDVEEALQSATENILNKQNLDETIDTLVKITEKNPGNIQAWQTLGDAYLKNNQIQQAIDAYTKAESALM